MARIRRMYGAHPIHVVVLLAALALTAYTISVVGWKNLFNPQVWWQSIAVWFAVAIIAHDLILFPLYALADRLLTVRSARVRDQVGRAEHSSGSPPVTHYLRMPTLASGLLLVMFFPGIIEQGAASFTAATGLTQAPYLTRWLLLTAAFYLTSALWYAAKTLLRQRHAPRDATPFRDVGGHCPVRKPPHRADRCRADRPEHLVRRAPLAVVSDPVDGEPLRPATHHPWGVGP